MSKRARADDSAKEEEVRRAVTLIRGVPAAPGEVEGMSLTPLERQVVALKESIPPPVILLVACGYRVKFFGRDSHVISRRSGIMCIPAQPFEYSSIPYFRVDFYVRRLIAMGYHVGFADQESAAVRAVDGVKSGIFQRVVSQLYSRGTLLPGERVVTNDCASEAPTQAAGDDAAAGQEEDGADTGPAVEWTGLSATGADASELYLCFIDAAPPLVQAVETVPPLALTLVSFVTQHRTALTAANALALEDIVQRHDIVEVVVIAGPEPHRSTSAPRSNAEYLRLLPEAYARVLQQTLPLHMGPTVNGEEDGKCVSVSGCARQESSEPLDIAAARYLKPYKLDTVYERMCGDSRAADGEASAALGRQPATSSPAAVLTLPGSTLRALDVFHSSAGPQGSLLSLLDHTATPCGARKLRLWLAAPLADADAILSRQAAVTFLLRGHDGGQVEDMVRDCGRLGDVEAVLGKLHAQRCGVSEYTRVLRMVRSVQLAAKELLGSLDAACTPPLLTALLSRLSGDEATEAFVAAHAAEMDCGASTPLDLFTRRGTRQTDIPPAIVEQLTARDDAQRMLEKELEAVRAALAMPGLEYRTIAGTAFVVDVPNGKVGRVPSEWMVLTRTKTNVRYHTPIIVEAHTALCASRDRLAAAAALEWQRQQERMSSDGSTLPVLQGVIDTIATLDTVRSLAIAAARPGYTAPSLVSVKDPSAVFAIDAGRHPVLDVLLGGNYISCDVRLRGGCAWILTGPNMGGKSAFMRMVGCFVVLAQMGAYVPAAAATLPVMRGLYCRMGASDSILEGSSTFLSEMEETSRILHARDLEASLVLMDELGRGTSSFDGVAVAAATLEFLVSRRVTTVFVTHYSYLCDPYLPLPQAATPVEVATDEEPAIESAVECYYMGFREEDVDGTCEKKLVFTYKPTRGVTPSSFGVDIAKMAGLPQHVTAEAKKLSAQEEIIQTERMALPAVAAFLKDSSSRDGVTAQLS